MTNSLKKVQNTFSNDTSIYFTSFTVDPDHDSAQQLKEYAQRFNINNTNWQLPAGNKKEIYKLARNSFMLVAADGNGGAGDFIHSEKLVLVDADKHIRGYYDGTNNTGVDQLIKDIKRLQEKK